LDSLEQRLSASDWANVGDQSFAEGEQDVTVVVGVLENGVAAIRSPGASRQGLRATTAAGSVWL
jgi:hypothetical protein